MAEVNTNPNTAEANGGGDSQVSTSDVSTNEGAEKTFTQAEVNEIVKQRLERQKKELPTEDEMDAFHKWQDGQKTAEQLSAEKLTAAENGKADAEKRAAMAEARYIALSHGIDKDAVDDVIALAMGRVSDSVTKDFLNVIRCIS